MRGLGYALRPGAPLQLLTAAAGDCAKKGWPATLRALLTLLRAAALEAGREAGKIIAAQGGSEAACETAAAESACAVALLPGRKYTVLHAAAAGGSVACCAVVLDAGGPECIFGAADVRGARGQTPLHAAARAAPAVMELLLRRGGQSAARAFGRATDADGVTPKNLAEAAAAEAAMEAAAYAAARVDEGRRNAYLVTWFQLTGLVCAAIRRRGLHGPWNAQPVQNPARWYAVIGVVSDPPRHYLAQRIIVLLLFFGAMSVLPAQSTVRDIMIMINTVSYSVVEAAFINVVLQAEIAAAGGIPAPLSLPWQARVADHAILCTQ